ncbi:hypothetical protein [Roseimaritima sediminicola]|uniref:hypothetical protein n=1 Tax=Roseimaritima sediminicola TaxID=2662066 RepID=UPI0012984BB5|nr:hypothetical protein [Roseimaritima sediminicola]
MNCWKERIAFASLLVLLATTAGGCTTICASPDLEAYNTYGGLWDRTERHQGRVASVFDPAGVRTEGQIRSVDPRHSSQDGSRRQDTRRQDTTDDATTDEGTTEALPSPPEVPEDTGSPETDQDSPPRPDLRDLELDDIVPRDRSGRDSEAGRNGGLERLGLPEA